MSGMSEIAAVQAALFAFHLSKKVPLHVSSRSFFASEWRRSFVISYVEIIDLAQTIESIQTPLRNEKSNW